MATLRADTAGGGYRQLGRRELLWLGALPIWALLLNLGHLPTWLPPAFLAIVALRFTPLTRLPRRPRQALMSLLAAAALAAVGTQYQTVLGRDPGVSLLLLLLGLKFLESTTQRDACLVHLLVFMAICANFLFRQELAFLPAAGALALLNTTAWLRMSAGEPPPGLATGLRHAGGILTLSLPLMLLLFALFPRISGPVWSSPRSGTGVTGLGEEMSPGRISHLVLSDAPAFWVTFDAPPPPQEDLYWRGPVLSRFDGRTWRIDPADSAPGRLRPAGGRDAMIRYEVFLEPHHRRWLLALDTPVGTTEPHVLTRGFQLLSRQAVTQRLNYRAVSLRDYAMDPRLDPGARRRALALPDGSAPRAARLAGHWRARSGDDHMVVRLALEYFHEHPFVYTLDPPLLDDAPDAVDAFVFDTRAGFCEHYAGSFAVLMRHAGIPARVVTGYQGGEWNPLGDYLSVRQADAHAWTEVWLGGRGWVRIDPTAAVAPERVQRGVSNAPGLTGELPFVARNRYGRSWFNRLRQGWDNVNYHWQRLVIAFGPDQQLTLLSRLGFRNPDWRMLIWLLSASLSALAVVFALAQLLRRRPRQRDTLGRIYLRFTTALAAAGVPQGTSEGALAYGQRAAESLPEFGARIVRITRTYSALRYGRGWTQAQLRAFRQLVREFTRPTGRRSRLARLPGVCRAGRADADRRCPGAAQSPSHRGGWRTGPM